MKININQIIKFVVLASFVLFVASSAMAADITAKSAPEEMIKSKPHPQNAILVDYMIESFESWLPTGWTHVQTNNSQTWYQGSYSPYDGIFYANIEYDPALVPQDEWLITPTLDFSGSNSNLELSFWWLTSYYWHVDPNNNVDLEVLVSTDDGQTWSGRPLWTEDEYGLFENWTWYNTVLELDDYVGESTVKIGFRYVGVDGAQYSLDYIVVTDGDEPLEHDVAVNEFLSPDPRGEVLDPIAPQVVFGNYGSTTESFTANLLITRNSSEVYNEDVAIADLAGYGETTTITFPEYIPDTEDEYLLTATAVLAEDQNTGNNELAFEYTTVPLAGYFEDFEAGDGDFSANNDWQHGAPTTGPGSAYSGDNVFGTLINGQYTEGPILSELVSPAIPIGIDATFTFWHWYATENTYDGGNVKISTNGGQSWSLLTPVDGYDGILSTGYENPIGGEEAFFGNSNTWVQETFLLSQYAGETIMIKFDYGSDSSIITGDGWYIDDFFLSFEIVGIEENEGYLPMEFNLGQNYPNPFNATTTINFTIPKTTDVNLVVFNLLGQEIATLVSEKMNAGVHLVNWNASDVSSGVYFYKLTAGEKSDVRRLTYIK